MKFSELEEFMFSKGFSTLASIARALETTPQAVSNWKSRDQVPYHIVNKIAQTVNEENNKSHSISYLPQALSNQVLLNAYDEDPVTLPDILVTFAQQFKVILISIFISLFLSVTYVQFIKIPKYESWATILLPQNKTTSSLSGLAGIASQFGVNLPSISQADLSSPSLFPQLIKSRTFAEKILGKIFYIDEFKSEISLLAYLTHGIDPPYAGQDTLISKAMISLNNIIQFDQDPESGVSTLKIFTAEALLSKQLAEEVIKELENLNRFYKSQNVSDKILFIEQRINSVKEDLISSEQALKLFNQRNMQASSPSLKLEEERLSRNVEVQKGIFLTLKQQLELSKIEEVQEASVVQILDKPMNPIYPINKNIFRAIIIGFTIGLLLGVSLSLFRSYLINANNDEKMKIKKMKNFIKTKSLEVFFDYKFTGIVSLLMIGGLPFYLSHRSSSPDYLGYYSFNFFVAIIFYIFFMLLNFTLSFYNLSKKYKK